MKKQKSIRVYSFYTKPQQHSLFKVVEVSQMTDGTGYRKRTLFKNLDLSSAEDKVYKLEKSNKSI